MMNACAGGAKCLVTKDMLFSCSAVVRDSLELPVSLSEIWKLEDVFALYITMDRPKEAELCATCVECWCVCE